MGCIKLDILESYSCQHSVFQSIIAKNGNVTYNLLQENSFDPWGNRRDPNTWQPYTGRIVPLMFERGFTGHEHLEPFNLINMNARMYDPLTGYFLRPDNYIAAPDISIGFNRYAYCLNNPLKYTDPDGEWLHLVIGAFMGGFANWAANGGKFTLEGLGYFGIGAVAGALTAGIGAGISSALPTLAGQASGGFAAGFLGTSAATTATSSFVSGALIGGGSGLAGGFTTGFGNALINGKNFGQALGQGGIYGAIGLGSGALIGGITGGIDARMNNRHFITGKPPYKDVSLDIPFVGQDPCSMDCLLANSEMLEKYYGGTRTIEDFREVYNALPEGATVSDYFSKAGFEVMGEPRKGIHIARTMEINKYPTTIIHNEGIYNGKVLDHNSTITRIRMWTPKSNATFWVNDPVRGANYRWSQRNLEKVLIKMLVIGGIR